MARASAAIDDPDDRPVRRVVSLEGELTRAVRPALIAFAVAAGLVLIVACSNVASILIGRTALRQRELAVRRALGASPGRLVMSVFSESLIIAVAGAAMGMVLAAAAIRLIGRWAAGIVPRLAEIRIDWTVLIFACAIAALASILGAAPAFRALQAGAVSLRASGAGPRGPGNRLRGALIVVQIALAVVLLSSGALLVRTVVGLLGGGAGIEPGGAMVSQLMLTETTRFDAAGRGPLLNELLRRIRTLPGVTAAGAGSSLPPDNATWRCASRWWTGHASSAIRSRSRR